MSDVNTQQQNETDAQQDDTIQKRIILENAYATLLGDQNVQTFSAFTFEDALDVQIEAISGTTDTTHPNLLERVAAVKSQLLQAVEQLKTTDPNQFQETPETPVNTPLYPDETTA